MLVPCLDIEGDFAKMLKIPSTATDLSPFASGRNRRPRVPAGTCRDAQLIARAANSVVKEKRIAARQVEPESPALARILDREAADIQDLTFCHFRQNLGELLNPRWDGGGGALGGGCPCPRLTAPPADRRAWEPKTTCSRSCFRPPRRMNLGGRSRHPLFVRHPTQGPNGAGARGLRTESAS